MSFTKCQQIFREKKNSRLIHTRVSIFAAHDMILFTENDKYYLRECLEDDLSGGGARRDSDQYFGDTSQASMTVCRSETNVIRTATTNAL